ncbi:FAD-dependent oxidoreductase, partial [Actinotalea ferrariae]|uniref:FAD-dependent oxidoreductase n=1 Tax=Actinotalea ferrariae TaxID=1386098 RepID=UPI0005594858
HHFQGLDHGHARFLDAHTVQVHDHQLRGRAYVVATGAAPHVPELPGMADVDYLTSTTAMEQRDLPASMVVVGGGYVGLEQAQLWAHL